MKKARTTSAEVFAGTGVDLHLEVQGPGVRAGLTEALREAVRSGRLAPGTRLPASRVLAADLEIARSTVAACYGELVEEGWLVSKHGSGTRVAERAQRRRPPVTSASPPQKPRTMHGLGPGAVEFAEFPRGPWVAAARRALAVAPPAMFGYGDPLGRMELRTALAEYLARVRGVRAEPENIVITSGFYNGLTVLAHALRSLQVHTTAVEGYGLDLYRATLTDVGMNIPPLGVDDEGACVEGLVAMSDAGAVLLTPAHQFPTGYSLSAGRRARALDWARSNGALIIEDDYDGEFRYDRRPVGALQGLDPEHVAYFGTASKSLAPALRLAWVVVPERLVPAVAVAKGRVDTVSVLDQLIFAEFVSSGAFDRHVRMRRHTYGRRRTELIDALAVHAPYVHVRGMAAGLQAVLVLPDGVEARTLQAAARQGLAVSGMSEFLHPAAGPDVPRMDALVVNFSSVSDSSWPRALDALCRVLP